MTLKSSLHAFTALATVASLATACQEDESEQLARSNKAISFNIVKSWEQDVTRSASLWTPNKAEYMGCDTLVSDDKQDTLYLERTISDLTDETAAAWTRANVSTKDNLTAFNVSCVKRNAEKGDSYYFQNLEVSKQASGNFSNTEKPYYWLETKKETYDFYAYAPTTFVHTVVSDSPSAPQFAYNAADGDNCDLMAAAKTGMSDAPADAAAAVVPLTFDHLLSGIRFVVDEDCADIKISKIEIKGLNWSGTCTYIGSNWTWSGLATNASKSLVRNLSPSFDTSADKIIDKLDASSTPTEASFFVVPQTIPAEAKIYLTYTADTGEKTLSAPISGTLEQGKLTTYTLKVEDFDFTVEQEGLHLKLTFSKGASQINDLELTSITFKDDNKDGDKELNTPQAFYGSSTAPTYKKLAGTGTVYYYDGSFFIANAVERYNDKYSSDYCWDSSKSIEENAAVKTQNYVVTLTNNVTGKICSKEVSFHFDYFEYISKTYDTSLCYLYDNNKNSGNFTMQDVTNSKWRNSGNGKYSDDVIDDTYQTMTGLPKTTDERKIRVYISSKTGVASIMANNSDGAKSLTQLLTPLVKSSTGKVCLQNSTNLAKVTPDLMAKQDNLTDLSSCFYNCSGLTSLDVTKFETKNVNNMSSMFYGCSGLTSLNLSSFNTENVTTMEKMFYNCTKLGSLTLSENFKTPKVTTMKQMFYYCKALTTLDLSSFNTSIVTTMEQMFYYCSKLKSLTLGENFKTSSVTSMSSMFNSCKALEELNLSSFDTSSVTTMSQMFRDCTALEELDLSNFNTSSVTTMTFMFYNCNKLTTLNVSSFDTSSVTSMQNMFCLCKKLTSLNVSSFNTSKVTDMANMFRECEALESLDLSNFNTSKVTTINFMFYCCKALKSLNLKKFSKDNVKNYSYTFSTIGTGHSNKVEITTNSTFKSWMTNSSNKSELGLDLSKVTIVT